MSSLVWYSFIILLSFTTYGIPLCTYISKEKSRYSVMPICAYNIYHFYRKRTSDKVLYKPEIPKFKFNLFLHSRIFYYVFWMGFAWFLCGGWAWFCMISKYGLKNALQITGKQVKFWIASMQFGPTTVAILFLTPNRVFHGSLTRQSVLILRW